MAFSQMRAVATSASISQEDGPPKTNRCLPRVLAFMVYPEVLEYMVKHSHSCIHEPVTVSSVDFEASKAIEEFESRAHLNIEQ